MAKRKGNSAKATSGSEKKLTNQGTLINQQSENEHFYVGIGASAGGLEALQEFFKHMPSDTGLIFIIIQHLSPDYKSLMNELLSRYTSMKIKIVEDGIRLEPNTVFLIPPKKNMTIFNDQLYLKDFPQKQGLNLPIDIFFRSLAEEKGKRSIGIILSGTGSDGTLGIRAIKEAGGMVMVQDDRSAKFDGMPRSSIATGLVDYVLTVDKMPRGILNYIKHPFIKKSSSTSNDIAHNEDALSLILKIIRDKVGVDFTFYKPNTILRRLEKRISINQIKNIETYVDFLMQSPFETKVLYKELLIGVTQFFRDKEAFELLREKAIPQVFQTKKKDDPVRFWCVATSTGEEAYSLAILISEYMEENDIHAEVKIFATDLDKESIEYAGNGLYPASIVADVGEERIARFFMKHPSGYQVREKIRKMVVFAVHNVIKDPPFSRIDMISCRNMLIYLNASMQKKIISMFYFALRVKGILFLGSSESLGELSDGFEVINNRWKIFQYKKGFKPPVTNNFLLPPDQTHRRLYQAHDLLFDNQINQHLIYNLYDEIMGSYLPPSIILNDKFEIIHIVKDINRFISIPTGKLTYNILKMVRPELSVVISNIVSRVQKEKKPFTFRDILITEGEKQVHFNIGARQLEDKKSGIHYYFITFEEKELPEGKQSSSEPIDMKSSYADKFREMEKELQYTRENLQATVEELETSNEELQSTNEELIASNEELQSTNEELQSVNEELYTVNSEYQNKIEELTRANNDINNLLNNTELGTLFLDTKLRIRKFTPLIKKVINLMDMDIGRPITHISMKAEYPHFLADIEKVLDTLQTITRDISDGKENYYNVKILPYRTIENVIDGVVITIYDISPLKEAEQKLERERSLLIRILENSPVAEVILNERGDFTFANKYAEKTLRINNEDLKKRKYNNLNFKMLDINGKRMPDNDLPFQILLNTRKNIHDIMQVLEFPDKTRITIRINGAPIFDDKGNVTGAVFSFEDITSNLKVQKEMETNLELLMRVLDNSPVGKIMVNSQGIIHYANKNAMKLLCIIKEDIGKKNFMNEYKLEDERHQLLEQWAHPFQYIKNKNKEIPETFYYLKSDGNKSNEIKISGSPVRTPSGKFDGAVFSLRKAPNT
ncbi:MAG: chemotaxis protein CheB [Bacteroidota bacterium]